MKETRILFTDLDGTLLTDEKKISPYTYHILEQWCTQENNHLVLCSGRALDSIQHVFKQLNLKFPNVYLIGCNGGEIYDCEKKQLLLRRTLTFDIIKEIFFIAKQHDIHIQTYSETHIITPKAGPELAYYKQVIHTPYIVCSDPMDHLSKEPCKCLAIELKDLKRLEDFRKNILKELGDQVSVIYSNPNYIELFPINSGKGSSILWLCDYLNIPVKNSIAAGDEMNDISMIQTAGLGVAMKNGRKEVQQIANTITAYDNNEDGLAKFLKDKYSLLG